MRQLKLEHAKEITKLRQEFELQARELQQKYEKQIMALKLRVVQTKQFN